MWAYLTAWLPFQNGASNKNKTGADLEQMCKVVQQQHRQSEVKIEKLLNEYQRVLYPVTNTIHGVIQRKELERQLMTEAQLLAGLTADMVVLSRQFTDAVNETGRQHKVVVCEDSSREGGGGGGDDRAFWTWF